MSTIIVNPATGEQFGARFVATGGTCGLDESSLVRTSAGAATVLAPPSPGQNACFEVVDFDGDAFTNPITVDGNGELIDGETERMIALPLGRLVFLYDNGQWRRLVPPRVLEGANPAPAYRVTPEEARLPTVHLNVGNVGGLVFGVAGVPTIAALAFFGQANIPTHARISVCHLHVIDAGTAGQTEVEWYRRRAGVFTLLGSATHVFTDGDLATAALVPATPALRALEPGDYIYAQALSGEPNINGVTVDVHLEAAP